MSPAARRQPHRETVAESGVAERVAERIRDDIRHGWLAPGQRLTEAELGERLKASRSPIREALRRLEADGVLTFEKHRGVSVRKLSRECFVHLLDVREVLEGLAARVVAGTPDAARAITELRRLYLRMGVAVRRGDTEQYSQSLYIDFHTLLIAASANPVLSRQWQQLHLDVLREQFRPLVDLALVQVAHREHGELLAALEAHQPEPAERAVRQHIAHFTEHIRRLPDRIFK